MSDSISFFIPGLPTSKGSLTRMPNGAMVPAGTAASRQRYSNWRTDVRQACARHMHDVQPFNGPVRLSAEFALPYPVSSIRKYQFGWWPHVKKPDIDKLTRALLDPMKGIVWVDDSQVCFATVNKVYAWDGRTGCHVIVDFLDEQFLQDHARAHRAVQDVIDSL